MIIVKTPFRIPFLGGGTDYRPYFEKFGGITISTTFNKYCYINLKPLPPFFEYGSKAVYSKIEEFDEPSEVEHPSIRECLNYTGVRSIHITYDAELHGRSGLGSSSAFTVCLLHALFTYKERAVSKLELAKAAIHVEHELIKESVGVQDQLAVAFGGLNLMRFDEDGYAVSPIIMSKERKRLLNSRLLLFYTGIRRYASDLAEDVINNVGRRLSELHEIKSIAEEGARALSSNVALSEFGRLLDRSWQTKKNLSEKISTDTINDMYKKALNAGAIGGKIMGAGGGGFMLLFAEPDAHESVKRALNGFTYVPFEFEQSGSHVIYYD